VNVDIHKARHHCLPPSNDLATGAWYIDCVARADGDDLAPLDDDDSVGNFFEGSECAGGADSDGLHKGGQHPT